MKICLAEQKDLETIMSIYKFAQNFMRENGNPNQWKDNYPPRDLIVNDIKEHKFLRVVESDNEEIIGVFYFKVGKDKTYENIEGKWLDESEYGVIHRIASNGKVHNFFEYVLSYCLTLTNHIRIDTHKDNKIMINLLLKNGFKNTGIIYCDTKEERLAFELIKNRTFLKRNV